MLGLWFVAILIGYCIFDMNCELVATLLLVGAIVANIYILATIDDDYLP